MTKRVLITGLFAFALTLPAQEVDDVAEDPDEAVEETVEVADGQEPGTATEGAVKKAEPAPAQDIQPVIGGADAAVVKVLLNAGANVHAKDANGSALLHEAAACGNEEAVKLLLKAGAEVRDVDNQGNTALHLAAYRGQIGVINLLLEAEANVDTVNKDGNTALMLATQAKQAEAVRRLLEAGADSSLGNFADETPLSTAYALGWEEGLQMLQEAAPKR